MNETEHRLLDTALTLFASQGYAATSVRQIIEAVGVTRPVLYYYCDNKRDLFKRVVRWKHDAAYRALGEQLAAAGEPIARLRAILRGTFAFCAADPRVPQLMFQTYFGPTDASLAQFMQQLAAQRFTLVASVIQHALDTDVLHGGDAASLALVFCSLMDHHANALSRLPHAAALLTAERADALLDVFLHGAGTAPKDTPRLPEFSV